MLFQSCTELNFECGLHTVPELVFGYLLSKPSDTEAVVTNISLEPTWRWYWTMTPFETVFLFLVIMQFCILVTFGIMPFNMNDIINGTPGRKRRETQEMSQQTEELIRLLTKLDQNECGVKLFCELEHAVVKGHKFHGTTMSTLRFMRSLAFSNEINEMEASHLNPQSGGIQNANLHYFLDAFKSYPKTANMTCQQRYGLCPTDSGELVEYVKMIGDEMYSIF